MFLLVLSDSFEDVVKGVDVCVRFIAGFAEFAMYNDFDNDFDNDFGVGGEFDGLEGEFDTVDDEIGEDDDEDSSDEDGDEDELGMVLPLNGFDVADDELVWASVGIAHGISMKEPLWTLDRLQAYMSVLSFSLFACRLRR